MKAVLGGGRGWEVKFQIWIQYSAKTNNKQILIICSPYHTEVLFLYSSNPKMNVL